LPANPGEARSTDDSAPVIGHAVEVDDVPNSQSGDLLLSQRMVGGEVTL
jgi:hypothetical protein